ncbi:AEC family transporter [Salinivibrio kushneri]|uniref:AEC family transporter n=1 Tax=Salinivibrio kushneri TaxID=1908198 RepID=A0AA47LT09_9GAMM|nr:AEC family transporter [Salinivibrio kushneri]WBA10514.1 AEC family transporter [Salinivibrio kushneri]
MPYFFESTITSLSIVAPIFFILFLGYTIKKLNWVNDGFVDSAAKIVFNIALPSLLFVNISKSDHDFSKYIDFLIFSIFSSMLFFCFSFLIIIKIIKGSSIQGVVTQASFRSNTAIVGIAYIDNAFGNQTLALAALYVAATAILYNIQAIICLSSGTSKFTLKSTKNLVLNLGKNPLIIAILLGHLVSASSLSTPSILYDTLSYLSNLALPLALLCTGASLNFRMMKKEKIPTWFATINKLIIAPIFFTFTGYLYGFEGSELGILFFMNAAPVAASSYAMTKSYGGDATLSANIIGLTTLISSITVFTGSSILKMAGLM